MTFPVRRLAPVLAAGLPLVAGLVIFFAHDPAHLSSTTVLFVLLLALAVTDWRTETVPDALTLPLVATGLGVTALWGGGLAVHATGAGLLLVAGMALGRFTRDEGWVGSGDYFLLAGIVAWFGPVLALEVALLAALVVIATCIITRRTRAALAPALAAAAALIWIGGPLL